MSQVAAYKKEKVAQLSKLMQQYPIVGIVNMENLPASQLQKMRYTLRGEVLIIMSKKTLMRHVFEAAKASKPGIEKLTESFGGMPALLFTKTNPFKIASVLKKSSSKAPAKSGQQAPFDIVVPAGPTPFAPGPIISELSSVGLKTGVEGGKVAVKEEKVVAEEGEIINQKLASVLSKLGIEPMDIGLNLVAIYENGIIYGKDVLALDEEHYLKQLQLVASDSLALALYLHYPAAETIKQLLAKAFNEAKHIAISNEIISDEVVKKWLGEADTQAEALKAAANIQDVVEEKKEELKPEENVEEKKEAVVEKPAVAEKKEEPKKEEIKPVAAEKSAEKKVDDVEKEIDAQIESMRKKPEKPLGTDKESIEKLADELKKKGTLREKNK